MKLIGISYLGICFVIFLMLLTASYFKPSFPVPLDHDRKYSLAY